MSIESRRAVAIRMIGSSAFLCSDELLRKRGYERCGAGVRVRRIAGHIEQAAPVNAKKMN